MKITLFVFLYTCALAASSQNLKTHVAYFNDKDERIDTDVNAAYYELDSIWDDETASSYSFYSPSGKQRYVQQRNSGKAPQMTTWYYESGGVKMKGLYRYRTPVGKVELNYEDGKPMGEVQYPEKSRAYGEDLNVMILQYWDSLGNKIISDGSGTGYICFKPLLNDIAEGTGAVVLGSKDGLWKGRERRAIYEETYDKGKLIEGTMQRDGKTYTYVKIEALPEYNGGVSALMTFISQNITYPKTARRAGAEGSVFVEFIVEHDGSVIMPKVTKGVSREIDAEALRVVAAMPKWKPGRQRGVPVRVRFVLPVKFTLG
jgi:TonB family protein